MRTFLWFLGLLLAGFAAMALFAYPAWTLLHPHFDFPFHRVASRIGMLALLVGFISVARRLGLADRASLGYGVPRRLFLRELCVALLDLGAVEFCNNRVGVLGRHIHKQMPLADVHRADNVPRQAGFTGNSIYYVYGHHAGFLADVHPEARLERLGFGRDLARGHRRRRFRLQRRFGLG